MLVSGEKMCGVLRCEIWFCAIKKSRHLTDLSFSVVLLEIGLIKHCYVLSMLTTIYIYICVCVIYIVTGPLC